MSVVSISLPDPLLAGVDRFIERRKLAGRSEFFRAAARDHLATEAATERGGARSATLTLVYPEGHERRFSHVRHTFGDVIRTMIHAHAGETCMEIFVLEGKTERVQAFADALRGAREALQVTLTYADAWKEARGDAPRVRAHRHDRPVQP